MTLEYKTDTSKDAEVPAREIAYSWSPEFNQSDWFVLVATLIPRSILPLVDTEASPRNIEAAFALVTVTTVVGFPTGMVAIKVAVFAARAKLSCTIAMVLLS